MIKKYWNRSGFYSLYKAIYKLIDELAERGNQMNEIQFLMCEADEKFKKVTRLEMEELWSI